MSSWYVLHETPKPPYEVTHSGPHDTEAAARRACPDDPTYVVWPFPAEPEWDE